MKEYSVTRIGKGLALVVVALFVLSCVYTTLYQGTTDGPDFIQAVQGGSISPEMISSLEIVEPTVGHMPFTTDSELLAILEGSRQNETDVPATWSRPVPPWEPKSVGQRFKQFLQKAVPWSVLPFLICVWFGMTYLIAHVGGWTELASVYGTSRPMPPIRTRGESAGMRAMINYRSCLRVAADEQGIYLVPSFQFRAFHPPLFIPWTDVTHGNDKFWFKRVVKFHFSRGPQIDLWIGPRPRGTAAGLTPQEIHTMRDPQRIDDVLLAIGEV